MKNVTLEDRVRFQLNFYKGCLVTCNMHIEKIKEQDKIDDKMIEILSIQNQLKHEYQTIINLLEEILKPEERKNNE